jgi:hypothetical protein
MKFDSQIVIDEISTDLYGADFVTISWAVRPINPSGVYLFNVYRSATNKIGDASLISHLGGSTSFNDIAISRRTKTYDLWYWVSVNKTGYSGEDFYGPKHFEVTPDPKSLKIRHDEELLLRRFIKNKCYFIIKRRFGERCVCAAGNVADLNCRICYGTGYIGGYYNKIEAYISISAPSSYHDDASRINEKFELTRGWTTYGPTLTGGDLVYMPSRDLLYLIKEVNKTILHGVVLRQMFNLVELPHGHAAYDIISGASV